MTLTITTGTTNYSFYTNDANVGTGSFELTITSQWTNRSQITVTPTLVLSNDRYSEWSFTLSTNEGDKHYNGMGNWSMKKDGQEISNGSLKLIYSPGGEIGTTSYTSNNENREADVFYRPAY